LDIETTRSPKTDNSLFVACSPLVEGYLSRKRLSIPRKSTTDKPLA
jgi:hypothetical protein